MGVFTEHISIKEINIVKEVDIRKNEKLIYLVGRTADIE
jgi:hypothetical protein